MNFIGDCRSCSKNLKEMCRNLPKKECILCNCKITVAKAQKIFYQTLKWLLTINMFHTNVHSNIFLS